MQQIGLFVDVYKQTNVKAPTHWKADIVNQIIELVGEDKKYNFVFWLARIKRSRKTWGECMDIIKKARGLDKKYNVGGFINNSLS